MSDSPRPLAPGTQVRFRVAAHDGAHGSSWSIRTAKNTPDVYLTHREGGRWIHISMHKDGRRHHAVTDAGQELVPGTPPYLAITNKAAEIALGWRHEVRITVDTRELRQAPESVQAKSLIEVPTSPNFEAVSIDVLLGAPEAPPIVMDNAFLVADIQRAGGGRAVVVARPMALDVPVRSALNQQVAEAFDALPSHGWDGNTTSRIVIFGEDPEGYSRECEIAIDPRDNRPLPRFLRVKYLQRRQSIHDLHRLHRDRHDPGEQIEDVARVSDLA